MNSVQKETIMSFAVFSFFFKIFRNYLKLIVGILVFSTKTRDNRSHNHSSKYSLHSIVSPGWYSKGITAILYSLFVEILEN